jgi:hypothetical protein
MRKVGIAVYPVSGHLESENDFVGLSERSSRIPRAEHPGASGGNVAAAGVPIATAVKQ